MKKRIWILAAGVMTALGLGAGMTPANAATPPVPTSVNSSAPACVKVYLTNFGVCWYGLN